MPSARSTTRRTRQPAPPPLTEQQLREHPAEPDLHDLDPHQLVGRAAFDISGHLAVPPEVTTRVVPDGGRRGVTGWRLEVTVAGGGLSPAPPPPLTVVPVSRRSLARTAVAAVPASLPRHDRRSAPRPRQRRLPKGYRIRFGDLSYQPTTIFNPDGRRPYFDLRYPWRCLVRITTPRGWSGSGALIGPRHVLTASHCVDWTPGWLTVDVMYTNGSSQAGANGVYAYASSRVGPGSIPDDEQDEDYAVIVLDQPLGSRFGWLGSRTYNSSWDDETSAWHSIGYPQDWSGNGEIAAWQTDFMLNELGADYGSARLIRSDTFDNWPGQSGSPIFGFWSEGPYVVGVVSGQGPDYNYISGGSLLPSLVNRARTEQP